MKPSFDIRKKFSSNTINRNGTSWLATVTAATSWHGTDTVATCWLGTVTTAISWPGIVTAAVIWRVGADSYRMVLAACWVVTEARYSTIFKRYLKPSFSKMILLLLEYRFKSKHLIDFFLNYRLIYFKIRVLSGITYNIGYYDYDIHKQLDTSLLKCTCNIYTNI